MNRANLPPPGIIKLANMPVSLGLRFQEIFFNFPNGEVIKCAQFRVCKVDDMLINVPVADKYIGEVGSRCLVFLKPYCAIDFVQ